MRPGASASEGLLSRWARIVVRHRVALLLAWAILLAGAGLAWKTGHGDFVKNMEIPGAESQQARDLLRERFPDRAGDSAMVVIQADVGLNRPEVQGAVMAMRAEAEQISGVVAVMPPYAPGMQAISPDGTIGYMLVQFDRPADQVPGSSIDRLYDIQREHSGPAMQVELTGQVITAAETTPPGKSELLGIAAAVVILLLMFGSVIAMGLPLVTAISGLAFSFFAVGLLARVLTLSPETRALMAMIGIGIGIDYALFIVSRFREGLAQGLSTEEAVVTAQATAGRSVLFAGLVVAIALLGLATMGIPFLAALGLAAALVVMVAVLVALTVLPALLVFLGDRIDRWRIPKLHHTGASTSRSFWARLAELVQRYRWATVALTVPLLLVLTIPAFSMRVGAADAGTNPTSLTSRRAYDLLTAGFGPGFNGPLTVVVDLRDATDPSAVERLLQQLHATPGIARAQPQGVNPAGDTAIIAIVPTTSPQSEATEQLVSTLRDRVLPEALDSTGAKAHVGGPTAAFIDIGDRITSRLPIFFGVVIGLSMLLLLVVFRSLLIPLQAAVMNLLSIGAAYGVLVAVFQWGWFSGLTGITQTAPIESFLPMMLFGVLFGLSTDYEVFLVSRMHELWHRSGANPEAVRRGVAVTARVIIAAASIMVLVFLSFTLSDARIVKEFGLGLATAIFIDATVIRLLLVPALMSLCGRANWYLPRWLDRRLPALSLEAPTPAEPEEVRV